MEKENGPMNAAALYNAMWWMYHSSKDYAEKSWGWRNCLSGPLKGPDFMLCDYQHQQNIPWIANTIFSRNGGEIIRCGWIGEWIYWPLGTTSNYSATANLHSSQITTAPSRLFQSTMSSPSVPWQRFLTVKFLQLPKYKRLKVGGVQAYDHSSD
jgi:hypothetical protein